MLRVPAESIAGSVTGFRGMYVKPQSKVLFFLQFYFFVLLFPLG